MLRRLRNTFKSEAGFTLIELLVVIAVLGILAGIAVPRLTGVKDKAYLAEAQQALGVLRQAEEMYYVENDVYTATVADLHAYVDAGSLPANWDYKYEAADPDNTVAGDETFTITMDGNDTDISDDIGASIDQDGNVLTNTNGTITAD